MLFVATLPALAQTPGQMEYERQQREYWRAQEQQREADRVRQQQQDNARRQQEEFNRSTQPSRPGSPAEAGRAPNAGSAGGAGGGAMPPACHRKPLSTGERNPLLGKWRPEKGLEGGDSIEKVMRLPFAGPCVQFQLGIEFREREIGTGIVPAPAHYVRDGDDWLVCLPAAQNALRFRVQDPDRLLFAGQCTLVREGSSAAAAATGAAPGAVHTNGATLAMTANVTGSTLLVLRKSIDAVLADAGIAPMGGRSRFKTWTDACESGAPACGMGKKALLAATAAAAKTDTGGNGRTPALPVGTYYVFGQAGESAMWNVRVDLKPGDNTVKLDARNATPID